METFSLTIKTHGTFGCKYEELQKPVQEGNEYKLKLELEPPTKTAQGVFIVKVKIELGRAIDKRIFWVGSICHFEVRTANEVIMMNLQDDATISQITHMVKTTIDQTRVYYQTMALSQVNTPFEKTIYELPISAQELRPKVAAALTTDKN